VTPDADADDQHEELEPADPSGLAQYLADLSQADTLPEGFSDLPKTTAASFAAGDVDFGTNDWMQRLIRLQTWLALDTPISYDASPGDSASLLFSQITWRNTGDCFVLTDGGVVQLTAVGIQSLEERLARAAELKLEFDSALEEKSLKEASDAWRESWEEGGSESRQPFGQINAKVESWKIKAFKSNAEEKLLDLNPSYQRDVVWSNVESQKLIESVLRGIPLPSVILTRNENSKTWQIVDGKQRLTAILRFIGHHPEGRTNAETMVGGLELFDTNFRKFARDNSLKGRGLEDKFMPFRLDTKFSEDDLLYPFRGKYYSEIRNKTLKVGGEDTLISEIFESESSGYLIPVIQYKNTKFQDIHRVFSLYNRQGKKLNAEELRNAGFHHLDVTRLLLVMSGDRSDAQAIKDLAPYIPDELARRFSELETILAEYGFGTARFKRTKVLSWATALMLRRPNRQGDKFSTPSTARQIDDLLEAIEEKGGEHPLHKQQNLIALAHTWIEALNAHADAMSSWSTKFRRRKGGTKWEELPLVASLIGTWLLVTAGQADRLESEVEVVRKVCEETPPPTKTQNKTQWEFIARFVTKLLDALAIDQDALQQTLVQRYEYSCVDTFRRLAS
jgi:hypothetical protein